MRFDSQNMYDMFDSLKKIAADNTKKLQEDNQKLLDEKAKKLNEKFAEFKDVPVGAKFESNAIIFMKKNDKEADSIVNDKVMDTIPFLPDKLVSLLEVKVDEKDKAAPATPQTQKPGEGEKLDAADVSMEDHEDDKKKKEKNNDTGTKEMEKVADKGLKQEESKAAELIKKLQEKKIDKVWIVLKPGEASEAIDLVHGGTIDSLARQFLGGLTNDILIDGKLNDKFFGMYDDENEAKKIAEDLIAKRTPAKESKVDECNTGCKACSKCAGKKNAKRKMKKMKENLYLCNGCFKTFTANEAKCPICKTGDKVELVNEGKVNEESDLVDTIDYKGYKIEIHNDTDPQSPDEMGDEALFLVHYHRDFWIEKDELSKEALAAVFQNDPDDERVAELNNKYWIFPVSAYIHGGVSLKLGVKAGVGDEDEWDTSHVGAIAALKKEFADEAMARDAAESLLTTWNDYLSGNVYGYIVKDKDDNDIDSVWGFYGDYEKNGMIEEAQAAIDNASEEHRKKHVEKTKKNIKSKVPLQYRKNESKLIETEKMKMSPIKTVEQARQKAIDWQQWQSEQSLSYAEVAKWESYFEELAKKFNLEDEFRENGIIGESKLGETVDELVGEVPQWARERYNAQNESKLIETEKMKMSPIKTVEQARQKAIDWQQWQSEQSLSYAEVAKWESYFEELAKKFNLEDEFRENGIIGESKLGETVDELVGEVPGIKEEDQHILRWAIKHNIIPSEFPEKIRSQVESASVYLKDVLLPKAKEAFSKTEMKTDEAVDAIEDPGTYRVTFYDQTVKELDANSKVDAMEKAKKGSKEQRVLKAEKIRDLDGTYLLPEKKVDEGIESNFDRILEDWGIKKGTDYEWKQGLVVKNESVGDQIAKLARTAFSGDYKYDKVNKRVTGFWKEKANEDIDNPTFVEWLNANETSLKEEYDEAMANAKFEGVVDKPSFKQWARERYNAQNESKANEQDSGKLRIVARDFEKKETADVVARAQRGMVVPDEQDPKKFMVVVKEDKQSQNPILSVKAKCSDMFDATLQTDEGIVGKHSGYVPSWFPGGGDYVEMEIDIETGYILNWKKPTDEELNKTFKDGVKESKLTEDIKNIRDLPQTAQAIVDSQEIKSVGENIGQDLSKWGVLFVELDESGDGYKNIWATERLLTLLNDPVYLIYPATNESKKVNEEAAVDDKLLVEFYTYMEKFNIPTWKEGLETFAKEKGMKVEDLKKKISHVEEKK